MSTQWQTYKSGCYTLRVPPGWLVHQRTTGSVRVEAPAGAAAITLSIAPRPTQIPITLRAVENELTSWVIRQHRVVMTQSPRPLPQSQIPACVTEGLEIPKAGLRWWRKILGPVPRILWRYWTVMTPRVTVYASTSGQPELLAELRSTFDRIISSMQISGECVPAATAKQNHQAGLDWGDIRDSVLPFLVEADKVGRFGPDCASQEWVNNLYIVYAFRDDIASRGITHKEVDAWSLDPDELHEQALVNLVSRSRDLTMEGSRTQHYTMLAMVTPDPFNASRILLPDLHSKLREHLGPSFYVAIPSADFLLAFTTQDPTTIGRIRQQMAADYARVQAPISPRLFIMTPDGVAGDPDVEESAEL